MTICLKWFSIGHCSNGQNEFRIFATGKHEFICFFSVPDHAGGKIRKMQILQLRVFTKWVILMKPVWKSGKTVRTGDDVWCFRDCLDRFKSKWQRCFRVGSNENIEFSFSLFFFVWSPPSIRQIECSLWDCYCHCCWIERTNQSSGKWNGYTKMDKQS